MRELTIYKRYFYDSKCYKNAPLQTPKGVQVHNTSSNPYLKRWVQPDDGRIGYNVNKNSHNNPTGTVCANAYIGKQQDETVAVYQVLPWNQRCWLSAKGDNGSANQLGYIGFEIGCDSDKWNRDYFVDAVLTKSVNLVAYLCITYNIDPDGLVDKYGKGVMSHRELHDAGYASNHGDIDDWLRKFGYTMNDYRLLVKEAIKDGVNVTYIDCDEIKEGPIMYEAEVLSTSYLNLRSAKTTSSTSMAKMRFGEMVEVLDDSDKTWWKIKYKGMLGFAMSQYLKKINTEPIPYEIEDSDKINKELIDELNAAKEALINAICIANEKLDKINSILEKC